MPVKVFFEGIESSETEFFEFAFKESFVATYGSACVFSPTKPGTASKDLESNLHATISQAKWMVRRHADSEVALYVTGGSFRFGREEDSTLAFAVVLVLKGSRVIGAQLLLEDTAAAKLLEAFERVNAHMQHVWPIEAASAGERKEADTMIEVAHTGLRQGVVLLASQHGKMKSQMA
jgi:hypothetical protein